MEPGWYTLGTGRQVWLQRLHVQRAEMGIMLGRPEEVRVEVLGRVRSDVERVFGSVPGVHLHPPADGALPRYLVMVEFLSPQPVKEGGDLSMLVVCWFSDTLAVDERAVGEMVAQVPWDAVAQDGGW